MKKPRKNLYRQLLTAALLVGGNFQLAIPTFAAGTSAGTGISNTATATYNDPNNPAEVIDATSNTVTITVAEVAGIINVASGVTDSSPSNSVLPGDTLTYDYLITNVGNDTTTIFIPAPVVTGPATQSTITYDVDANGDGTFDLGASAATATTTAISPGGAIRVHVAVVVATTATSGAPIVVRLGDTPPNDNSAATQNQPDGTADATDVRTVDAANGVLGETTGAPTNGEREASANQQILVGAQPQAFATVLKTQGAYSNNSTVGVFNDDLQTYNLSLRVENAAPTGADAGLVPADLEGTPVNVNGITTDRILISDVIPTGTVLSAATPVAPTTPGIWTVVYSIDPPASVNANAATWVSARPASGITRVGYFINSPATVVKGTTVTGFSFQVVTSGLNATSGGTVANLAQLFGETVGGGTTIVYDESGDQTPTNFNDNGTRGPNTADANGDGIPEPVIGTGVANPATDGTDPTGTNTGTGVSGEDNVLILAPAGTVLNGPNGAPTASGPTSTNDDFTNQSTDIPAGTIPNALIDPAPEAFTNTINAPTTNLTNILLRPDDGAAVGTLPAGSTVTLTFGANSAVYTYNGTDFVFSSGTSIQIPSINAGTSVNYTTTIDLPANTALSTDLPIAYPNGYPAPIIAFSDVNGDGVLNAGESSNTTIDRVYTGFLRLVKESKILSGTGPTVIDADFSVADKTPAPGNIISYRITYTNISTVASGSGNVTLNASNVAITESGVTNTALFPAPPNGNNWGQDYSLPAGIDTSNVIGSAVDSGTGATITYFSGTAGTTGTADQSGSTPTTDVTRYLNTISVPVGPGVARIFTFNRRVN